jgi:addiction module HigA family antidote
MKGGAMASNMMRAIHPGEILREGYLGPLGLTANALALALHLPAPRVNDVVRERRAITPDTALRLSRYFETSPQYLLNLQSTYDLKQAEQVAGRAIALHGQPRAQVEKTLAAP